MKQTNKQTGFASLLLIAAVAGVLVAGATLLLRPRPVVEAPVVETPVPENQELIAQLQQQRDELLKLKEQLEAQVLELGAVNAVAGATYRLSGSGVSGSATSFTLTSFTIPQTSREILDADMGDTFYVTFEPGSASRQEIASCTTVAQSGSDNTATISGCTRGLLPFTPFTASTTYQFAHGGGTAVVFSNPPQFYNLFGALDEDETVTGAWNFSSSAIAQYNANPTFSSNTDIITKKYADDLAIAGAPDSSLTVKGLVEQATGTEAAAGTATGDTTAPLAITTALTGSSSASRVMIPVTQSDGTIKPGFLPTDEQLTWTGAVSSTGGFTSASSTLNGSTTVASLVFSDATIQTTAFAVGSLNNFFATTTATGTWTAAVGTNRILFAGVGGGGGGASGASDVGGGGGGGACYEYRTVAANATGTWITGAGGPAGTVGSSTSLTIGGTTYSADAGAFGSTVNGGGGGASTGCDIGNTGAPGVTVDATDAWLGMGGVGGLGGTWGLGGRGNAAGTAGVVLIYEYR